ncbi:MAG: DUF2066 domain-containing protein [gamma proteobacterium symbiont of Ctena orbiculata]|nr:DUF2066 domain-containing protein [Candidatus Thiodiazotropha sp. (ex Lucina pensylvanica)]MBT3061803.1 DUF2066 domain-containing protein [Candidatus Thiodiazotropha sp. (ex Lucina pensylvanica)]MBV2096436.1 DUF2066 domain-containing protein [Candidatus Thiodiazotropha sp. (ex Codakia orbicularis)]PUB74244.1 MAG: DUF2066 domain-containing protein [gamma proteobacterium symbiont of Ctena orbiculata]PUB75293.1 MAG: DUF2066 domain-containing protein [gamma proteobacterium symbiont of Ctena orbi
MMQTRLKPASRLLLLLLALLTAPWAAAEKVGNLYEAKIAVSGQSAQTRAEGIRKAFARVMVKVSGDRGLLNHPEVPGILNKATAYVQQYRYMELETGDKETSDDAPDRLLWVRFDERAVNRLLRESGVPVWGGTRPSVLVWLGQEQGARRDLLSLERERQLKRYLNQVGRSRGLSFLWPIMDIEDRNRIRISDLWGGFEENIRRASARYQPDVILVGRMSLQGRGSWRGEWLLYLPDKVNRWQTSAGSKAELAGEGLNQAVDALALRFAPRQVSQGVAEIRIRVHGLSRLEDYVLVKEYLQSLAMIESLDLLSADSEKVNFLVRIHGGREALERGIQLGAVLEPAEWHDYAGTEGAGQPEIPVGEGLVYRLR